MRLEPLYRARFTTPESWSVDLQGPFGTESQKLLFAEGRCDGRVTALFRGANFPRRRVDGTLTPDFRGVLETDDGVARSGSGRRPMSKRQAAVRQWWRRTARLSSRELRRPVPS